MADERSGAEELGPCPVCKGKRAHPDRNPTWPFCGPRCRAVDLGRWLRGDYVISTALPDEEDDARLDDDDA